MLAVGCGPTSDRLRVSGEVLLDGAPLDRGSIRFSAIDPEGPLSAGTVIREGAFDIPQEKGLPPGEYRVSISAPDRSGKMIPYSPGPGQPSIPVAPERIPPRYNIESDQTVTLEAGQKNFFEYDIASTPQG